MIKHAFFVVLAVFSISSQSLANGSSTHGGDGIRLLFENARFRARDWVNAFQIGSGSNQTVEAWIVANAFKLADDIEYSPYQWLDTNLKHDAMTTLQPKALIKFSTTKSMASFSDKKLASQLLIHESVHHLGISDEAFADAVATTISVSYNRRFPERDDWTWTILIEDYHDLLRQGPSHLVYQLNHTMLSDADRTIGKFYTAWKALSPESASYNSELAEKVCAYGWEAVCQSLILGGKDIYGLRGDEMLPVDEMKKKADQFADKLSNAPLGWLWQ